jgi:hypothetical protein
MRSHLMKSHIRMAAHHLIAARHHSELAKAMQEAYGADDDDSPFRKIIDGHNALATEHESCGAFHEECAKGLAALQAADEGDFAKVHDEPEPDDFSKFLTIEG